jgi:U3 small nucleolar RNA-associated protein 14
VLKQGVLSAPLPTVVQDRLNREAAYEKTKEEGAKWATLMKRVKEAEHLSFPLQGSDRGGVKSSGEMLAEFKPQTKHENAVQALLAKANLTESGVKASEDEALKGQDLSTEEIAERRGQLRLQRELMFREEAKAKRVSKIKSKTFRKMARKRAAKAGEADLEAMDEEELAERQEKLERERAKERATLKHSAKTGRWAKDGHAGGEERDLARAEMFDLKERLNRRIQGRGDNESEEDESDDEDEEEDEAAIKRRAFDQLDQLEQGEDEGEEGKGLMGMKFMKKAEERRRQERKEEEAELRRDIEMFGGEEGEGSGSDSDEEGKASKLKIGGTGGRMVFSGPRPVSLFTPLIVLD